MFEPRRWVSAFRGGLGECAFGPIGLDLGPERAGLVQLERRGGGVRIGAARTLDLPAPGAEGAEAPLAPLLRSAVRGAGFRGRRVVTLLPDPGARLMVVNFPLAEGESEAQRILRLVEERIDEPVDECVVDYLSIRTSDERAGERSALVAVAQREGVTAYLELLRGAGLRVDALEIAPLAIHRLVAWLTRADRSRHAVVLYAGRKRTHLTVSTGRRLLLYREVDFGEDAAVEAVAKALDMAPEEATALLRRYGVWPDEDGRVPTHDPAEALEVSETVRQILTPLAFGLAEEIRRAGVYTASQWRGAAIDGVWLLGAFAGWPRADRLLESLVSLPTGILDPGSALASDDEASLSAEDMTLAAGLALRGFGDG